MTWHFVVEQYMKQLTPAHLKKMAAQYNISLTVTECEHIVAYTKQYPLPQLTETAIRRYVAPLRSKVSHTAWQQGETLLKTWLHEKKLP